MSYVRFTNLVDGKVHTLPADDAKQARRLYKYAVKVATASFLIELVNGGIVAASHTVDYETDQLSRAA